MVAALVRAALVHRSAVFVLAAALVGAGVWAARQARLDVFPEFAPPIVEVQTEAPGFAAEDVEALVTTPLERALGGMPEVAKLRSSSALGLSVVSTVFVYGTDPYRARQLVIERVAQFTIRRGLILTFNLTLRIGILADYRRVFWAAVRHALMHGRIEDIFGMTFVAHHLIVFTRDALRGKERASFYTAKPVEETTAPAGLKEVA